MEQLLQEIGVKITNILLYKADAKCVVNNLRKEASDYSLENGHTIPISVLSMRLGDTHQVYT